MMPLRSSRAAAAAILGALLILSVLSARHLTLTYDEPYHYRYGLQILKDHTAKRFTDSTMPVSALNAVPRATGDMLAPLIGGGAARRFLRDRKTGRYVTVLAALLLGVFVYRWARELYGPAAGLFSLALYAFEPNFIAHGQLVTTDLYAACAMTVALYYFWRFEKRPGRVSGAASALTLGLAQLTKHAAILLYPVFLVILAVRHARALFALIAKRDFRGLASRAAVFTGWAFFFAAVSAAVVNAGFLFEGSGTPFGAYEFKSALSHAIQSRAGILNRLPLPLPYPYLEGLDWSKHYEEMGGVSGNPYLFGRLHPRGVGFTGYYLFAFLYKVPLAVQACLWAALAAYLCRRERFDFPGAEAFLLVPPAAALVWFGFFFKTQVGIRYFLFAFPPLIIFCGSLLKGWDEFGALRRTALACALVWLGASVLSWYPHFLPYFNELVPDRTRCYRILADSNIDWGQGGWYLRRYVKDHPGVIVNPEKPSEGRVVVGVNLLTGVFLPERYRWLRENFEPVGHVAHAYLVYDIAPGDLARLAREGRLGARSLSE